MELMEKSKEAVLQVCIYYEYHVDTIRAFVNMECRSVDTEWRFSILWNKRTRKASLAISLIVY